jgi:multidrug efflux pump subunit AcrB
MSDTNQPESSRGAIAWMAGNSVASNLLMLVLLIGGLLIGMNIKQEVFPYFAIDTVVVSVSLPGASPEEVENSVVTAIEDAVQGLEGVDEIRANAAEGYATVYVDALEGADVTKLWQEVKSEVDRITTFPQEAKEPQVNIAARKRGVLTLALFGDVSEQSLREMAEKVRDELLTDSDITQVELTGVRDFEIHIEVSQETLRRYGLTMASIASRVSKASVDLGGGSLRTTGGEILVRVKDRREYAREFARLPIITGKDGSQVLLGDIASVTETFEDTQSWASYNGKRAVQIEVYRVGNQTPIQVAAAGRKVVERINESLPEGVELTVRMDRSKIFEQRADLLVRNAFMGLGLVFLFLALFLEIRLAFWVSLGIPISFLGSALFLGATDFSINMITMFAFIVTLGIVVDDAIVVGENVYYHRQKGLPFLKAAILGAKEVAMPVTFSVLTNMVAFLPMMFVPGVMGKIFKFIPYVVIGVFGVSLIESLFILPAHLGHGSNRPMIWPFSILGRWQAAFSNHFVRFVQNVYGPFLRLVLRRRYVVLSLGLAMITATAGYVTSGRMGMVLFPKVESDYAYCEATLPYGASENRVREVEQRLVKAARIAVENNGGKDLAEGIFSRVNSNVVQIRVYLVPSEVRPLSTTRVTELWREQAGSVPGLESIDYQADRGGPGSGKGLTIQLSHRNKTVLDKAGQDLAARLAEFPIVSDIDDGTAKGKRQYDIKLRTAGERMGLTSKEVATQVRHAFYGAEAVRQQRGNNEVTVRVRLPESQRTSEATLEDLVLLAPEGEILLRDAVDLKMGRAYTTIVRYDARRVARVTANVRPRSQAENIMNSAKKDILPQLVASYPGLSFSFEGHQADIQDSMDALYSGLLLALLCIYAMLAIPFRSYFQPVIIMFCIPFGMIGAVVGHVIMGYTLSLMSLFGVVALAGVVVNDSLVMIDFANRRRREGMPHFQSIWESGIQRFRPIMLTTLTTCGGLAPMILETSRQARFLIPMAISLGFGILFATFITLVMVPSLYLVLEDIGALLKKVFIGGTREEDGVVEPDGLKEPQPGAARQGL